MLEQPMFAMASADAVGLVRTHPWATLISPPDDQGDLVVSHLPVLQDPEEESPVVLGHLAAADARLHDLGSRRVVVVVQGPHGYLSPTWYQAGPYVPTWNFAVVHLHGTPEVLGPEETFRVLDQTCVHLEQMRTPEWHLAAVQDFAARTARHTTGFRLRPDRVVAKAKMSQDKPPEVVDRVIAALRSDPFHGDSALAHAMEHHRRIRPTEVRSRQRST